MVSPGAVTTIRLIHQDAGQLEPIACRNIDDKVLARGHRGVLHGFGKPCWTTRFLLRLPMFKTDPRVEWHQFARDHVLVSYLGVPLIVKDECSA